MSEARVAASAIAVLIAALPLPAVAADQTITCGSTYSDTCFDCDTTTDAEDDDCTTYTPAACDQPLDYPDLILDFTATDDVWIDFSSTYGASLHMNLHVQQGSECATTIACADWTGGGYAFADGWGGSIYGGVTASAGDQLYFSWDLNSDRTTYADYSFDLEYFECCFDLDGDGAYDPTDGSCTYLEAYYTDYVDCDDEDADNYPLNTESCDDADNDCDGVADNGLPLYDWYYDGDKDGYGSGTAVSDCGAPGLNYTTTGGDCVDTDSTVNPGATEVCNGKDDDCDGSTDEGVVSTYYADTDGDGHGDASSTTTGCTAPSGYVSTSDDCDDNNADRSPSEAETCDGRDNDCDLDVDEATECTDDDGDGYAEYGGDCDDAASGLSPSDAEGTTCNGVDDDCDGVVDDGTECFDDDGDCYCEVGPCAGSIATCATVSDGDCNDGDADASPGETEVGGDGIDNDCDGSVDAGAYDPDGDGYGEIGGDCDQASSTVYPGAPELADGEDNDCDGVVDEGTSAYDDDGDGYSEDEGDCNDASETMAPDRVETEDGRDEDCDDTTDEGTDAYDDDGDGASEHQGDCDDADATVSPDAEETANGVDDDCDGEADEGLSDRDADGVTAEAGDCDDSSGWIHPSAGEMCDGLDNDCDGDIDESCDETAAIGTRKGGCGCATGASPAFGWALLGALGLVLRRRR